MPIPTALISKGKGDLDTSQLSAYAVYNNLVPGVKAYQDTSESTQASKRKKSKKKANKKAAAEAAVKSELNKLVTNGQGSSKKSSATTNGQAPTSPTANGQTSPKAGKTGKNLTNIKAKLAEPVEVVVPVPQEKLSKRQKRKSLSDASVNQIEKISPTIAPTSPSNNRDRTKERNKRRRNKKNRLEKSRAEASANPATATATEEAPPNKLRKLNTGKSQEDKFLPNPFAIPRNTSNKISNGNTTDQAGSSKKKIKNRANFDEKAHQGSPQKSVVSQAEQEQPLKTRKGRKPKIPQSDANELVELEESESPTAILPAKKIKKNKAAALLESEAAPEQYEDSADLPNVFDFVNSKPVQDSLNHGESLFNWLIHPQPISKFKSDFWEKAPLLIKRKEVFPEYYEWILSTAALDDMLRKNVLKYSENIDITAYEDGVRETISNEMTGRARPAAVWDYYATGHSVRILNPQTYCKPLWRLNASLQEWFGCFVGANVYLTPPDSQGFAPHYDDIEAFILQVEGKKHWKVYKPRSADSELPQFSSKDFKEDEDLGEPVLDVILEEGDLLYFPRGWIHQAKTVDGCHSMHITLSCYQQNTWSHLLKQHFEKVLEKVTARDVNFRRGLPMDYMSFMGMAHSKSRDKNIILKRKEFKKTLRQLIEKVVEEEADDAADQMGKKFIWDSLPPYLTRREKDITVNEDGEFLNHGRVKNRVEMDPDVEVKLLRKNCIRLVQEEKVIRLYFSIENSLVYHADEPQFLEVPQEFGPAILYLIQKYPEFTRIEELPMESDDITKKIQLVSDFWERGIVMTKKPLEAGEIDEEDFEFDDDDGEEMLDDEDDDLDGEDDDISNSDDDEEDSEDGSFIDDSSADMDGDNDREFMSDEDNSNDDEEDGVEVLDLEGMEETDEDEIVFEESD